MSQSLEDLGAHIKSSMTSAIEDVSVAFGELTITARAEQIVAVITFLRDDPRGRFTTLIDICGVDYPERTNRFDVVYHLLSMHLNQRIRIKVRTDEMTPVPSVVSVFPVANWYERETFDMYGVIFSDHPDMRRILTDYGFEGYPLRKDFPLTGRVQVRYDEAQKRVINEPVKLVQEYRNFDFLSPWEGMQAVIPGDEKAGEAKK